MAMHVLIIKSYKSNKLESKVVRLLSMLLETWLINFRNLSVLLTLKCIIRDNGEANGINL